MKDETAGAAIEEFVRLKPKVYSYLVDNNNELKKGKRWEQKCYCNNKS